MLVVVDERGQSVEEAGPATPVQVLGAKGVPQAGDAFQALDADKAAEWWRDNRESLPSAEPWGTARSIARPVGGLSNWHLA